MQIFVTFSLEVLDLKSFIRHGLSKFAGSHDISDIKDFRILTLYKKVYSWFFDKPKFDFFLRFPEQK